MSPLKGYCIPGDCCFNFVTPATFDADIGNWIRTTQRILKIFNFETVVPGHGPVGDRRAVEEMLGYLKLVRREAKKRFNRGMSARRAPRIFLWVSIGTG